VAVESDEADAGELAGRALAEVRRSLGELHESAAAGGASAGVAEWFPAETSTGLIERADRALLYGKQERDRGSVIAASELPRDYRPAQQARRRTQSATPKPQNPPATGWPARAGREQTERLRKAHAPAGAGEPARHPPGEHDRADGRSSTRRWRSCDGPSATTRAR
jgi:hypothetical protein